LNHIKAVVTKIETIDYLSVVSFEADNQPLRMMALGLNVPIEVGSKVTLGAKATNIALAKNLSGMISMSNQLNCVVEKLNKGSLLCSVKLSFNDSILESITTLASALEMDIEVGDKIVALIKASELSVLELES
jgi:molybdopterin-binding protein